LKVIISLVVFIDVNIDCSILKEERNLGVFQNRNFTRFIL